MAHEFFYKQGIERNDAFERIGAFRNTAPSAYGVYYSLRDLQEYIAKYYDIIDNQDNPIPEGYDFFIGHYFAWDSNERLCFIVAPVLVNKDDPDDVLDAYSHEELFVTDLRTTTNTPHFFYNEGHLWP